MSKREILHTEIEANIRDSGKVSFEIGAIPITLDLSHRHERYYAASLLLELRYPQGDVDRALFRRFVQPGDQVLDAGANIGVTALELLETGARRVIAAEPVPALFARLAMLPAVRVVAVDQAISGGIGQAAMTISLAHNQGSSLKDEVLALFPYIFGDQHQRIEVGTTTIDALRDAHGAFDIWKLDIEGAEVDALAGARRTLAEAPPRAIIAELFGDLRHPFQAGVQATHPHGYRAFLRKSDYALELVDIDTEPGDTYHHTSPMFVFCREPAA
ncbi:FkbM family methyltransferase [Burkholderia plantarii]|uniref:FkbM family methyltransferase n=1 Tax=Burkholderia plantarii TaxID=41899 RepID=UPI00272990F6|nr:FkbM family methyltransferase [Burkholderia plantarii]WLE62902.1 FkbM family methyltransferase [Burkholderia plantarii]